MQFDLKTDADLLQWCAGSLIEVRDKGVFKRLVKIALGVIVIAVIALGYPIIGFYFPSSDPIPTADKSKTPLGEFCTEGQQFITETNLPIDNQLYDTFDNFVASKAYLDRESLRTSQFITYGETRDGTTFPKLVSCKFKSASRIKSVRGEEAAGQEKTCKGINERTVAAVLDRLALETPPKVIFEEDEVEDRGQLWLDPWPYPAVSQDDDETFRIRAGAVVIEYSLFNVMPARFLGVHYCHLITPDYAEGLFTGTISTAN